MVDADFADATYYPKTDPQEISARNNESRFKPRKIKVKHDIQTIKDKPMMLLNSIARDFILPLAHLSGAWVNPYWILSIFLSEGPVWSTNHLGPTSKRELKDLDSLLSHMKLAPQLL